MEWLSSPAGLWQLNLEKNGAKSLLITVMNAVAQYKCCGGCRIVFTARHSDRAWTTFITVDRSRPE